MEDSNTAVDNPELSVLVEVGHDAGDDPGDVQDVEDRNGNEGGGEKTTEVPSFPIFDDDHQKQQVQDESSEGES